MIIPKPSHMEFIDEGTFKFDSHTEICDSGLDNITEDFNKFIHKAFGFIRFRCIP